MPIPPDADIVFTAPPGVFGNLVVVNLDYEESAPDLTITVSDGTGVLLTIGTTGGTPNLEWDAIAALWNADPTVSLLAFAEGNPTASEPDNANAPLTGGAAGLGAGQFFAGGPAPPPTSEIEVDIVFCGVVRYMIREEGSAA